mmetsp:Transcript_60654/g.179861  ORF Transcript_60654/g.179861 Transcript_60654/m.179861 type:complete len:156 (-) Transcript_60654:224-691(-)
MPRAQRSRRGGGGSMFGSRKRAAPPKPKPTPPAPAPAAHPPAQQSGGGGMMSGIGSTIAQGMAFGTGSAIAHRAVGAVAESFGGTEEAPQDSVAGAAPMYGQQQQQVTQQMAGACDQDKQMFFECLQMNKGDQESCRFLYDTFQTCQRDQTQMQM